MHKWHTPDPTPADIRRGYEGTEITVRSFVYFIVGFVLFAAVVHAVIYFLLGGMTTAQEAENNETFPPPVLATVYATPPDPRLQPSPGHARVPFADLNLMREEQKRSLENPEDPKYAWEPRAPYREGEHGEHAQPEPSQPLNQLRMSPQLVEEIGKALSGGSGSPNSPTTLPVSGGASGTLTPQPEPGAPSRTAPQEALTQPPASERNTAGAAGGTGGNTAGGASGGNSPATGPVTQPAQPSPAGESGGRP